MKSKLRPFIWVVRIAGVFILTFGMYSPVFAVDLPDLTVTKTHTGDFAQADENKTYTITVINNGLVPTDGSTITVTDTLPTGLTAVNLSSSDPAWTCPGNILIPSTPLTCTRTTPLAESGSGSESSVITLTVDVNVDAGTGPIIDENPIFLRTVTNTVTVSGGGDLDGTGGNNIADDVTRIIQKPDLRITGYELRNEAKTAVITIPPANQSFWIRMTIENRGGVGTGAFYPGVFLDGAPNYGPDHDPLGEVTNFSGYRISPAGSLNASKGCLYYDPAGTIDPLTQVINPERGNYTLSSFIPNLPANTSTTVDVHIAYPVAEYPDPIYDNIRAGLSADTYQVYLYADPTCLGSEESFENNNVYGPITFGTGTQVDVIIAGTNMGTYNVPNGGSQRVNYVGVNSGPVVVQSAGGVPIIAAIRESWWDGTTWSNFAQVMGLPATLVSDTYLFPAYNNVSLDEQLRFGNVGVANTTVTVTIGGVVRGTYDLAPSQSARVNYAGLNTGPVVVKSSGGVPIIAAIREAWWDGTTWSSFSQLMGLPATQVSDTYLFPAYNNISLDEQLRVGNVGIASTTVTVTIGGVVQGTYPLAPSESFRVNYAGLNTGPVVVKSSGGVPIIAAIRDAWWDGTTWSDFNQLMGLPAGQVSDTYLFPAYNNISLDEQLRVGNVGVANTTVTVTIGGVVRGTYDLIPSESFRVNYVGLNTGPVVVKSSGGVPIIAAIRDSWWDGLTWSSFSQLMGLPASQVSDTYLFPAYNNISLDEQLRFGVP